jgi:fumarate hydratase subunit alpha
MTRTLASTTITEAVRQLCIDANYRISPEMIAALERAREQEESPQGRQVLGQLLENWRIAGQGIFPICQDTGYAVLFVELGQDLHITGGNLNEALTEGVRQGYREGYLRKSLVRSPLRRENTGDNTPPIIYYDVVPGEGCSIALLVKGCGCDNRSALRMLTPAEGVEAATDFIVETVAQAGPNASPPVIVGVGLGGTFEKAALLSKKALLRPVGQPSPDPEVAALEREVLTRINALGIGPAGFGGTVTALAVHVELFATHIAALPVAVNLDCHSHRCKAITL